ncbi:hypothetical protein GF327_02120 [Candidatus Woesearchaeota archaeon]|nr:hypothetical protein [Candidatus Woesearchaeota archaeon]
MTYLIACLSTGKGTWGHVSRLIKSEDWEKVFLITNEFGKERFSPDKDTRLVLVPNKLHINKMVELIKEQLKNQIDDTQVAVNFVSGTGKEHMALVSALLKMGLALRFVYMDDDKWIEL